MLEQIPHWLGALFRNMPAGHARMTIFQDDLFIDPRDWHCRAGGCFRDACEKGL